MSFNVYITHFFEKEFKKLCKKYPSAKDEFKRLVESLGQNPQQGNSLGKDCYKIRVAISSKGKGKSGGCRVIFCVKLVENSIFLLSIYDKGSTTTISDKELDKLLQIAGIQ